VTVTDAQNCTSTHTLNLVAPTKIRLNSETKQVTCFDFANGEAQIIPTGAINLYTYKWDSAAGGQTRQRALGLRAGSYRVTVTDSTGCIADTLITITQPSSLRINNVLKILNKCVGDSLGGIAMQLVGGTPQYKIRWERGDTAATLTRLRAGTYRVTVKDLNDCTIIDSVTLVQPNGVTAITTIKPVKCHGNLDGSIVLNASGGTPPYRFSTDDRTYNGINSLVGLKSGDYYLYVKDNNDCTWFDRVYVPTPAKLSVDAGVDRTIELGDSTRLSAGVQNAQGRVLLTWKAPYDSTLSCKICASPVAKPLFTIKYDVYARDTAGCTASDDIMIKVEKPRFVIVPTGFTPNADNVNDILYIHGKVGVKIKSFRIFDRWGEMVYSAHDFLPNDPQFGWDGKFHGEPMNTGIFVWAIEVQYLDGATDALKGNFTLLR
jgi:gliding motility-associated-like protein